MNEETQTPVEKADAQSAETETEQKNVATPRNEANQENAEQKSLAKTEEGKKVEQSAPTTTENKPTVDTPVTPTDKTADAAPKDQNQSDTDKPTSQDKPAETKPTDPAMPVKPEQPKKLADVVPTTLVWISGVVGSHQIDCAGPIELPFKLDKPEWPYTTVAPNSEYTNQVFDYDSDTWVATDAKSQGQQLTDLIKKVSDLQEDSASHEKSADQSQKMSMQLTQSMILITNKLTMMEGKLDTLLNTKEKDGDK
jgi:hypothetical protein